jgi:hypothetical protein
MPARDRHGAQRLKKRVFAILFASFAFLFAASIAVAGSMFVDWRDQRIVGDTDRERVASLRAMSEMVRIAM